MAIKLTRKVVLWKVSRKNIYFNLLYFKVIILFELF